MRSPAPASAVAALTAGLAVLTVVPGLASAAEARAAASWRVPASAVVTVRGHGYGHGHGMSQYGAEGAARRGLDHRQIAEFYYPGTTWGSARGRVTVLISDDTTDDLVVEARPGLTVRDTAGGPRVALPDNGADLWRADVDPDGATVVSFRTDAWHPWQALQGQAEFFAAGQPVTLMTPQGSTAYRGRLRVALTASGSRVTVNDVSLESYLRGVVPLEIPASWSPAAVRAQAVAARTYAAYERDHPLSSAYGLCDTSSCQVYGGYDAEHPASDQAVADTARQVLLADGRPAFTQFGSSNGGWTSAGSVGYLPAKPDPYDGWSGNPVHSWSTALSDRVIERAFPRIGDLRRIAVPRRDGNGEWGGRVRDLVVSGTRGRVAVSGDTFRSALGLRSSWFTFAVRRAARPTAAVSGATAAAPAPRATPRTPPRHPAR